MLEVAEKEGAIPFNAPGAELHHRGGPLTFDAIIQDCQLIDRALLRMAKRINAVDTDRLETDPLAAGYRLCYRDDHENLGAYGTVLPPAVSKRFPLYNASLWRAIASCGFRFNFASEIWSRNPKLLFRDLMQAEALPDSLWTRRLTCFTGGPSGSEHGDKSGRAAGIEGGVARRKAGKRSGDSIDHWVNTMVPSCIRT